MPSLAVIPACDPRFSTRWAQLRQKLSLAAQLLDDRARLEAVRSIVEKVRLDGDRAVAELTAAYDQVELDPSQFRVPADQLRTAHQQLDPDLLACLRQSIANVRAYQEKIKVTAPHDWAAQGVRLGLRYRPLQRVGVCVPGASAPLVSTVIMTVVPAQVAGVHEIAIISSPSYQGTIHPTVLGLCHELQVPEVYRVSGAQAVAALAFGTENIARERPV